MTAEPRNKASETIRARYGSLGRLADLTPEQLSRFRSSVAEGFVREDRRRLVAIPSAGVDQFIADIKAYWTLGAGAPTFEVARIIAVRGEHLVLFTSRVSFTDGTETESLVVSLYDSEMRALRSIMFDTDDEENALTELGRLHAELG